MSSQFKNSSVESILVECGGKSRIYTQSDREDTVARRVLDLYALGNRYYELAEEKTHIEINIRKVDGSLVTLVYDFARYFVTNFRSGGVLVDGFVDQIGTELEQICWLVHDCDYTPCELLKGKHPLSKNDADELLYVMLAFAGLPAWKDKAVWASVHVFGASAYRDDDELTEKNSKLFTFGYQSRAREGAGSAIVIC
jgi:hypothetical protein